MHCYRTPTFFVKLLLYVNLRSENFILALKKIYNTIYKQRRSLQKYFQQPQSQKQLHRCSSSPQISRVTNNNLRG